MLDVSDLRVRFDAPRKPVQAVDGVSFSLSAGEVLALVGESGSGKSVCAMSLLGLTRGPHTSIQGSALLDGQELIGASEAQLRAVRGARMSIVFQDPRSSLNPVLRIGDQSAEQILAHEPHLGRAQARARAEELLERVRMPAARARLRSYPHELSGGMRQRAMIAMALSLDAPVLLADEPTTALDVTVQAQILDLLDSLRAESGLGVLLITHDFGVVARSAHRVAVMRAGRIVEPGATEEVLRRPQDPYTRELRAALAPAGRRSNGGAAFGGRIVEAGTPASEQMGGLLVEMHDVCVSFASKRWHARTRARARASRLRMHSHAPNRAAPASDPLACAHRTDALAGVSLAVYPGETLALVGESGSGKTTLIRSIARLVEPDRGVIRLEGVDIARARRRELASLRRSLGMVFQDPHASLNPRRRVGASVELAVRAYGVHRGTARTRALELLERVGLSAEHAVRYPHELSGGECQRVAIARALAGEPRLVLLDEPVSSLDASLRRGVIELLADLQAQLGCSYVLVSHDLDVVAGIADRIAVMRAGRVVELGDAEDVLERPTHPYTRELLAARPVLPGGVGSPPWVRQMQ
ncbi:MAG: dipeptide ABC transporter ATP-binding protein [Solirubrobacteraceae bacterium]